MRNLTNLKNWWTISVFLLVGAVFAPSVFATGTYDGGDGLTAATAFQINTPVQMDEIGQHSEDWGSYFILTADIDLSGYTGTALNIIAPDTDTGTDGHQGTKFTGSFDGNGHTIRNFTYTSMGTDYIGLFGYVSSGGEIKDLGMTNVNVDAGTGDFVGGLVGYNTRGKVSNCYATGSVSGYRYVGGLVAFNYGMFSDCYATGNVMGNDRVGGLCGSNQGSIDNCYSTCSVTGGVNSYDLGGLCGWNSGSISNCYSAGLVTGGAGSSRLGGLCGWNYDSSYTACFWDITVNPSLSDCGYDWDTDSYNVDLTEVFAETTANMQIQSTLTDAGWDFVGETDNGTNEVWQITPDSYPLLSSLSGYVPLELTGDGTLENPYLISDANELGTIYHYESNTHYQLTADIDLWGITWSVAPIPFFDGTFDGAGHTISNLIIDGGSYIGLFGRIGTGGKVSDLVLINVSVTGGDNSDYIGGLCGYNRGSISDCNSTGSVTGDDYVGGLVGWNWKGTVSNCYSTSSVTGGDYSEYVGGLMGLNDYGTVSNCYAAGNVTGDNYVGGLVGVSYGTVSNCQAAGTVTATGDYVGGLCGHNYNGNISNCFSTGSVIGGDDSYNLGGLVGWNWKGTVSNCYSTSSVTGDDYVGGLVGLNERGSISDCYAAGNVAGEIHVGGLVGYNDWGPVSNCQATGTVTGDNFVGGLVGYNYYGTVSNCYATGSVSGDNYVGGLVGRNYTGMVSNCYATGTTVTGYYVGGLVGENYYGTVSNCYAAGTVTGGSYLGGLVGKTYYGTVSNCYATGTVTGDYSVGGLVGYNLHGSYTACFWDITVNPLLADCGYDPYNTDLPEVFADTTENMQIQSTFTDAGWDFVGETANGTEDIWIMCQVGQYPSFWWQCNTPPVADAGPDQTAYAWIDGIAEVQLDGSDSNDVDGDELTYLWTWTIDANEMTATGVDPNIQLPVGEHTIELIVNDGREDSEPDYVVISVIAPVEADVYIVPSVINRNNHLKRVMAIMRLPEGIEKGDVVRESFELYAGGLDAEPVGAIWERVIGWGDMTRVFALFDKDELMDVVPNNGRVELTVVGRLESGQYIQGWDTVRIVKPRRRRPHWQAGRRGRLKLR